MCQSKHNQLVHYVRTAEEEIACLCPSCLAHPSLVAPQMLLLLRSTEGKDRGSKRRTSDALVQSIASKQQKNKNQHHQEEKP
mmetsp:Transcript_8751/g.19413  ORF Transcript_8751/g.19413 Transcript_8751/m.19413 type:complete len:82 (+) Transcript_8751:65-310(+)